MGVRRVSIPPNWRSRGAPGWESWASCPIRVEGGYSAARLGRHGPQFVEGMEALRHLVYAFYAPDFHFKKFLDKYPGGRDGITNLLTGNAYTYTADGLFRDMDQMLKLQDYQPLRLPGEQV